MNESDRAVFLSAWSAAYELCSRGKVPSPGAMNLAFDALSVYPLQAITAALTAHCRSSEARYGLVPADIVTQIDGGKPTVDQIIAAAMKPTTALAVLCRIEIGSWNLDNWDRFKLAPLAESCISQIPEWRARIERGELHEHERVCCLKYGAHPKINQLAARPQLDGTPGCDQPKVLTQETKENA